MEEEPPYQQNRWRRRLDGLLSVLVLVLAFLAASFVVHNSDFWFHLATGRLLANGGYAFGVDPFAFTTQHVYWTNHAWLFDLALYALHSLIGGAGLVLLKALMIALLAWLLMRWRRPSGEVWIAAACTTLAVLAMSPRLLLQPACLSFLLLGVSLRLLDGDSANETVSPRNKRGLLLLFIFVIWVNVDEWFLLGPLLVGLFWIGERLQGLRRTPGWLLPASLAVCLLNPHTYHAFALPADFSPVTWTSGLRLDARFQASFASPWQTSTLLQSAVWQSAAALAYFALMGLGLLSFLLHRPAWRSWRFVVWISFALLAAVHLRAIPFFAVVAGPITALNLQDALGERDARLRLAAKLGFWPPILLLCVLLGLLFLAWPGWLQGYGREGRHVAWNIQPDSSLQHLAQTLDAWRKEGKIGEGERVFALHPDAAHYCAWFCPDVKYFFDHRYPLFSQTAQQFEDVSQALLAEQATKQTPRAWQTILHEHHVRLVLVYDPDWRRVFAAEHHLDRAAENWALLDITGRGLIFGAKEPHAESFSKDLAFAPQRQAYGNQEKKRQDGLPAAPQQGPGRGPQADSYWTHYATSPAPIRWESDAAMLYLRYFDEKNAHEAEPRLLRFQGRYLAGLIGQAVSDNPQTVAAPLAFRLCLPGLYRTAADEPSAALPLLAVRASRQAIAANPDDENAYFRLGLAYGKLRAVSGELSAQALLPPLSVVRYVQMVTALHHALRRNPDLELAHELLADLYSERQFLDCALEHRRRSLYLTGQAGLRMGEDKKSFAARLEPMQKAVGDLEKVVLDRKNEFILRSRSLHGDPVRMARQALELGLAQQALDDILLRSQAVLLGAEGVRLQLHLLLFMGRAEEFRTIRTEVQASKDKLGFNDLVSPLPRVVVPIYRLPTYEWFVCLQAAACGDYAEAAESLREIRMRLNVPPESFASLRQHSAQLRTELPRVLIGELGLHGQPQMRLALPAVVMRREEATARLANDLNAMAMQQLLCAQQADLLVVEGMLALEQGSVASARQAFTAALSFCPEQAKQAFSFAGWELARRNLQRIQDANR